MIVMLCLNPAVDRVFRIPGFAAGEDYPGQRPETYPGGKGVNAARVLSQLGEEVHLVAWMGMGGEGIRREMSMRCPCTFLEVEGSVRSTVNVIDPDSGRETVISEQGFSVTGENLRSLYQTLEGMLHPGDVVACSGSLPQGAPADLYARIGALADEKGAQCAVDCQDRYLKASLNVPGYVLGKPNERELCALAGVERTRDPGKLCRLARELMPPFERLVISMGGDGGLLVTPRRALKAELPRVRLRSSVGSGDAAFAGALSAVHRGASEEEVLALSMACGAANAEDPGVGTVKRERVLELLGNIRVREMEEDGR